VSPLDPDLAALLAVGDQLAALRRLGKQLWPQPAYADPARTAYDKLDRTLEAKVKTLIRTVAGRLK
jgi:hypothetical protein